MMIPLQFDQDWGKKSVIQASFDMTAHSWAAGP